MYRTILFIACLTLSPSVVAQSTMTIWHKEPPQTAALLNSVVDQFNQKSGSKKIVLQFISQQKFRTAVLKTRYSNTNRPAAALVPGDFIGTHKQLNLMSLDRKEWIENDLNPTYVDYQSIEGKLYGIPLMYGNHLMLAYNRSLVSKPADSWSELLQQKKSFVAKKVKPVAIKFSEMYWFAPFLGGYNGWPLSTRGEFTLDTKPMVDTLKFFKDMVDARIFEPACRLSCVRDDFYAGKYAYSIIGDWDVAEARSKLKGDLGITRLPKLPNGNYPTPMVSVHSLVVFKHISRGDREVLRTLALFLQSKEIQKEIYTKTGRLPVNTLAFPDRRKITDPVTVGMLDQLKVAKLMPTWETMAFAWEGMGTGFRYFFTSHNAKRAASIMQEESEKLYKRK